MVQSIWTFSAIGKRSPSLNDSLMNWTDPVLSDSITTVRIISEEWLKWVPHREEYITQVVWTTFWWLYCDFASFLKYKRFKSIKAFILIACKRVTSTMQNYSFCAQCMRENHVLGQEGGYITPEVLGELFILHLKECVVEFHDPLKSTQGRHKWTIKWGTTSKHCQDKSQNEKLRSVLFLASSYDNNFAFQSAILQYLQKHKYVCMRNGWETLFLTWGMSSVRTWGMHLSLMKHFGKLLKHICRFLSFHQPASEIRGSSQFQINHKETMHQNQGDVYKVWLVRRCSVCKANWSTLIYSTFRAHRANWITQSAKMWALCVWVIGMSCFS